MHRAEIRIDRPSRCVEGGAPKFAWEWNANRDPGIRKEHVKWFKAPSTASTSRARCRRFSARTSSSSCRSCSTPKHNYAKGNKYNNNPYGSEYAMFRGEDGSASRMLVSWDTPSFGGEDGRIWGQKGCFVPEKGGYCGWFVDQVKARSWKKRALPNGMSAGGHGGSYSYLTDDFIHAILDPKHRHCVDVVTALNTTVAGIYAHKSALKGGEILKIPEFSL